MPAIKIIGLLLLASVLAIVALVLLKVTPRIEPVALDPVITNFEECAAAGNAVMESYPRQCRSKDGRLFVEEINLSISTTTEFGTVANGCAVAGCSSHLCVSAGEADGIITTCEFRAGFACYKEASCELQADGKCGWTQTAELQQCLAQPPESSDLKLEVM